MMTLFSDNFIIESLGKFVETSGFMAFFAGEGWKFIVMIALACFLLYLAMDAPQYRPLGLYAHLGRED